ncbi:MAG: ATP-binding protein, partial [Actinobacteria bacterium]|nr:ATP-binding protein [Actinomycetota bacterium]
MSVPTDSLPLLGREESLARLEALTEAVRAGAGGAVRIEGAPGVGKSALLAAAAPADLTVLRAVGVEAEAGLPLAGLEDLMHGLDAAAGGARGAAEGSGPIPLGDAGDDRDPVALLRAVSTRLAEAEPLVCLVDDVQWLDPSSRAAIAYLARR